MSKTYKRVGEELEVSKNNSHYSQQISKREARFSRYKYGDLLKEMFFKEKPFKSVSRSPDPIQEKEKSFLQVSKSKTRVEELEKLKIKKMKNLGEKYLEFSKRLGREFQARSQEDHKLSTQTEIIKSKQLYNISVLFGAQGSDEAKPMHKDKLQMARNAKALNTREDQIALCNIVRSIDSDIRMKEMWEKNGGSRKRHSNLENDYIKSIEAKLKLLNNSYTHEIEHWDLHKNLDKKANNRLRSESTNKSEFRLEELTIEQKAKREDERKQKELMRIADESEKMERGIVEKLKAKHEQKQKIRETWPFDNPLEEEIEKTKAKKINLKNEEVKKVAPMMKKSKTKAKEGEELRKENENEEIERESAEQEKMEKAEFRKLEQKLVNEADEANIMKKNQEKEERRKRDILAKEVEEAKKEEERKKNEEREKNQKREKDEKERGEKTRQEKESKEKEEWGRLNSGKKELIVLPTELLIEDEEF